MYDRCLNQYEHSQNYHLLRTWKSANRRMNSRTVFSMNVKDVIGLLLLLSVQAASILRTKLPEIIEVTQENFEATLKEKKCMFMYASRENCEKCKLLYHKFITVSQTFADEHEVFFGNFTDRALVDAFDVTAFPQIVYYEFGSAMPNVYRGDITTAALNELVTKAMKINSRSDKVKYAVQLTKNNFDEIIRSKTQYRLIMLHEDDDDVEVDDFDELAEAYDNDLEMVFARINVDLEKYLDNKFFTENYPSFYWYPKGTVDKKKRYGGDLILEQMISFINQQTGLHRMKGGRLNPFAGLIKQLDDIIDKHGKHLYELRFIDEIIHDVKAAIPKLPKETDKTLIEYYIYLLDEVNEDRTIESLGESRSRLYRALETAGPLERDMIMKKKNIVNKFIDIIGKHMLEELSHGEIKLPQDLKDYMTESEHGIEFHEEF